MTTLFGHVVTFKLLFPLRNLPYLRILELYYSTKYNLLTLKAFGSFNSVVSQLV